MSFLGRAGIGFQGWRAEIGGAGPQLRVFNGDFAILNGFSRILDGVLRVLNGRPGPRGARKKLLFYLNINGLGATMWRGRDFPIGGPVPQ